MKRYGVSVYVDTITCLASVRQDGASTKYTFLFSPIHASLDKTFLLRATFFRALKQTTLPKRAERAEHGRMWKLFHRSSKRFLHFDIDAPASLERVHTHPKW